MFLLTGPLVRFHVDWWEGNSRTAKFGLNKAQGSYFGRGGFREGIGFCDKCEGTGSPKINLRVAATQSIPQMCVVNPRCTKETKESALYTHNTTHNITHNTTHNTTHTQHKHTQTQHNVHTTRGHTSNKKEQNNACRTLSGPNLLRITHAPRHVSRCLQEVLRGATGTEPRRLGTTAFHLG